MAQALYLSGHWAKVRVRGLWLPVLGKRESPVAG